MTKYIAKPDTWFDEGTEVALITDFRTKGYEHITFSEFEGLRTCKYPKSENKPIGTKYLDSEVCSFDEFDVIEG